MKLPAPLVVYLRRRGKYEAGCGTLAAFVIQNGQQGTNLLSGQHVSNVSTAKQRLTPVLQARYGEVEILWEGEGRATL
jgi:hypothetical protein